VSAGSGGSSALSKRAIWIAVSLTGLIVAATGIEFQFFNGGRSVGNSAASTFVGSETCAGCHQAEAQLWRGSQHGHAMAHATDASVLGDFSDASFDYYGLRSRFFRKDEYLKSDHFSGGGSIDS
jgi:hypothetical protein